MFLILFLILAISCYSQNIVYSLKGQFLAEKIVEEKALAGFSCILCGRKMGNS
jgi:hypothetical protein